MFKSLLPWVNVPFIYKPFVSRNGSGEKQFGTAKTSVCYPSGEVTMISDRDGKEIVSMTRLYVPGTCDIQERDNVVFEGHETEIKTIKYFYSNGIVDIKVVYL